MSQWVLGIIGGSGLYAIEGLEDRREQRLNTPWGDPSDSLIRGRLSGIEVVFLPRHGRGHAISPTGLNARANIAALKMAGCTDIVSFSACGSLRGELAPGSFVLADQIIDRTFAREKSFFGEGCVAHVSMANPVCGRLSALTGDAVEAVGGQVHRAGTYLIMEGPQFSTRAESELYRAWGCEIIGMTAMPEAKLAREAELPFAIVGMVTDYDCWHDDHGPVDVSSVLEVMTRNADTARQAVKALTGVLSARDRTPSPQGIENCLDAAIVTPADHRDPDIVAKLSVIAGRVFEV